MDLLEILKILPNVIYTILGGIIAGLMGYFIELWKENRRRTKSIESLYQEVVWNVGILQNFLKIEDLKNLRDDCFNNAFKFGYLSDLETPILNNIMESYKFITGIKQEDFLRLDDPGRNKIKEKAVRTCYLLKSILTYEENILYKGKIILNEAKDYKYYFDKNLTRFKFKSKYDVLWVKVRFNGVPERVKLKISFKKPDGKEYYIEELLQDTTKLEKLPEHPELKFIDTFKSDFWLHSIEPQSEISSLKQKYQNQNIEIHLDTEFVLINIDPDAKKFAKKVCGRLLK